MGIPNFFSHVIKEHGEIIKKYCQSSLKIDNLYLDSNSIIYDAVNELRQTNDTKHTKDIEEQIIKLVCLKIKNYIDKLQPDKTIFIAFDGVAPIAKLSQQRNRRVKTSFQNDLLREMGLEKNKFNWETTAITPGTIFMDILDKTIKKVFEKLDGKNVIISTSTEPGEGEHKIFNYIKQNVNYHKNTTTVIYGLDADLIMLSLNHLHITKQLYLYRETPHFIKSINRELEPNMEYLLDIPLFSERLQDNLGVSIGKTQQSNSSIIFDYIFMCFLLGNDFLPHFPSLNIRTDGIQRIMDCYKTLKNNIKHFKLINIEYKDDDVVNTSIVWKNVREFIGLLSKSEDDYITTEMIKREKMAKHLENKLQDEEERLLMIPILNRNLEEYINVNKIGWENRYYKVLFDVNIDENNSILKNICINYLEGIEWTWKYYMHGCIDWEWKYNYHYPPLLKDLINYIPYFDIDLLTEKEMRPVHPYVQLAYVLPKSSLRLLPDNIKRILLENHKEWYEFSNKFIWAFCKYFWESHCELPHIDIKLLESIIQKNI